MHMQVDLLQDSGAHLIKLGRLPNALQLAIWLITCPTVTHTIHSTQSTSPIGDLPFLRPASHVNDKYPCRIPRPLQPLCFHPSQ